MVTTPNRVFRQMLFQCSGPWAKILLEFEVRVNSGSSLVINLLNFLTISLKCNTYCTHLTPKITLHATVISLLCSLQIHLPPKKDVFFCVESLFNIALRRTALIGREIHTWHVIGWFKLTKSECVRACVCVWCACFGVVFTVYFLHLIKSWNFISVIKIKRSFNVVKIFGLDTSSKCLNWINSNKDYVLKI